MERISAPRRPVLEDVQNRLILADGSAKPFRGKGTFELEVEGRRVLQEVWIADIELEGILGMDFVRRYDCQIVAAPGGQLELFIPELKRGNVNGVKPAGGMQLSNYPCLRVKVEDTVLASAKSEVIMAAKVLDKCDGGLEPTLDGDQVGGEPWVRQKKKDVRRKPQPKEGEHQDQQRCLPLELEEWINRSADDLDDKQVGVLTDLLHEHQDVVATSKTPFSRTSITHHRIVTGESKPMKQVPGRRPLHLKEKAEEEIEKMLAKGIVEPSSCPWSFPVVLVEEKNGIAREEQQKKQRNNSISSPVIRWLESGRRRPKWEQTSSLSPELKGYYNQRSRANSYREGEKVWLYNPQSKKGRSPKLQTPWEGPWEVTKQVTDVVYRIQKTPKGKLKFVHHDRLKPFHERNLSRP